MAAFPYPQYQYHTLHIDPFSQLPNSTPIKISSFWEEYPNNTQTCLAQFLQPDHHQSLHQQMGMGIPVDVSVHESSCCLENSTKLADLSYNDTSVTNKHSTDSSSVVDKPAESGEQVTQKVIVTPMEKKRKGRDPPQVTREVKGKKQKKSNSVMKDGHDDDDDQEKKAKADDQKDQNKGPDHEEAPTGYIHVRARRGQATDSHSLAERVRREKISERMKLLQALVPGCDKVTGKALILDEIINYVQSLQNQVEFLSLRLASLNPMLYDFGVDLDAFMVTPERLNSLVSPLPNVQKCSPAPATDISDSTTTFMTGLNSYTLLDTSSAHLFQQGQRQNILSQDNRQVLWDVDGPRQKLINQSGFINNLCSFH